MLTILLTIWALCFAIALSDVLDNYWPFWLTLILYLAL